MSTKTSEVARRLHRVLVEEIRSRRPELLEKTFSVAEIYQDLVPYRTHRERIGVEMNGDYEHALLRLLGGDEDYLEVQSEAARRHFREELGSLNPDTGVVRRYAAVEVRLNAERIEDAAAGADSSGRSRSEEAARPPSGPEPPFERNGGEGGPDEGPTLSGTHPGEASGRSGETDSGSTAPDVVACPWCRERLPERDDVAYCPFCGSRVDRRPCPSCGTELESAWHFCVSCGSEVGG